ncbi:MAG TPA: hypothetical protein VNW96_05250 [Mycobacterium sp.]|jgi:hypothetical protein|nr:hypothetical protein [Mycobacterium sp.]
MTKLARIGLRRFTDMDKRVLKLAAGSQGSNDLPPWRWRDVLRTGAASFTTCLLPASNTQTVLAVDTAGNVYVLDDSGFGQVVKLAAS